MLSQCSSEYRRQRTAVAARDRPDERSLPRPRPAHVRSAGPLTEYQDVAVGVLYLKLPIAVGLLLQWTTDRDPRANRFVEAVHTLHSDVRIPHSIGAGCREVRLVIALYPEKHELDSIALETGIRVRFDAGHRACSREVEGLIIPASGGTHIGDDEGRHRRLQLNAGRSSPEGIGHSHSTQNGYS